MSASPSPFPWQRATFLHERAPAAVALPLEPPSRPDAERRADAWRQFMSGDEAAFAERLRTAGLDREGLLRLLARAGEGDFASGSEGWTEIIREVLEQRAEAEPAPAPLQAQGMNGSGLPFVGFFQPFLRVGAARLRAGVDALERRCGGRGALLTDNAELLLFGELARRLQSLATRVLVLELNVARLLEQLPGDTAEERYRSFSTTWFQDPKRLAALLQEYPVLARLMGTALERWQAVSLELLERLAVDRDAIAQTFFGGQATGPLEALQLGISDSHRRGHSVALLRFASGQRLVYKPKSLEVDLRFQQLLGWLNEQGLRHPHRALAVLARDGYGYVEFAEAKGCPDPDALHRFYYRQGSSLSLLHVLAAVDFHLENLIAAGEHPVLVDLEALFHHRPHFRRPELAAELAGEKLERSVLSVGMLPTLLWGNGGRAGIDMSGLGGAPGQLSPLAMPQLEDTDRDTMRLVRKQGRIGGANNRPKLGEEEVSPSDYTDDIVQGFEETYALLQREREALSERLGGFANVEVRYIARATQRYASLLQESEHPDFLRDGLERDKVLDHLWAEVRALPALRRLIPHEHADLRLGDIPMFTARPGLRHVWSSTGEIIPNYFDRDSLSEVRERLANLSDEERAFQVSLIRQSMASLAKQPTAAPARNEKAAAREIRAPLPEDFEAAAVEIGEKLARQAIHGRTDVNWIGLTLESADEEHWNLAPIGAELYEGVGGLAIFFAYLARHTGRRDFEALARKAMEPVRRAWREPPPGPVSLGPFSGRTSALYVLDHLSALWNEPALLDEALATVSTLEPLIDADKEADLLGGAAGAAVVLLRIYRRTGDARLLALARRCGERLLATALPQPQGIAWQGALQGPPLVGFSHGTAGIAWALLELAATTGDARYHEAAVQALRYERTQFVPARGNWRDLREHEGDGLPPGTERFMTTWCHGAPGIALGRLLSLPHLDSGELRAELSVALETTLRQGFGGSHCLCHGELGNLESVLLAGQILKEPRYVEKTYAHAARILREGREDGWLCGLPQGSEAPGLLVGLSGIGLELLRIARPEEIPSVLALEGPR